MNIKTSLNYDNIGLQPIYLSEVRSRDDVDTSIDFLGQQISLPLIVAPMETVVGEELCRALKEVGGIACLPRTSNWDKDRKLFTKTMMFHIPSFSARQIEPGSAYWDPEYPVICIDVANGFNKHIGEAIKAFRKANDGRNIKIITGNIGSIEGYRYLTGCGVDAVRVGIGSGAGCTTSLKTGVGIGQWSLIREIANYRDEHPGPRGGWPLIIADGGIRGPREVCLALTAGADVVMAGKLFVAAEESNSPVIKHEDRLFKHYAGQASKAVKRSDRYIEGTDTLVPLEGNLSQVWSRLSDGIRSCMSYMNCKTIEELKYLPDECFRLISGRK
jgi:IMP dehydrogenase